MSKNIPEKIVVHHTGGTDKNPLADTSNHTIDIIRDWHLKKGWRDVGYHYVIHKDGSIHKGREENDSGAHTYGHNKTSIGICLSGNFDATLPTQAQENALRGLLIEVMGRWDISKENIYPHREFAKKTCCGNKVSDDWARDLVDKPLEETKPKEPMKFAKGYKTYTGIILVALSAFGIVDSAITTEAAGAINQIIAGAGTLIALYGRYDATK